LLESAEPQENRSVKTRWTRVVDQTAAEKLTQATLQPGVVYPLATSDLPQGLRRMQGAQSYFVSAYSTPIPTTPGVSAAGEMVVLRKDAGLAKAYNYVFATSSGGNVYYAGPFKHFDLHHLGSTEGVAVVDLFGHSPWQKKA